MPPSIEAEIRPKTLGVKPKQANEVHRLLVKQYYACQSKGFHTCEQSRLHAYEEKSRVIDADGHVMIFKRNGEVTVRKLNRSSPIDHPSSSTRFFNRMEESSRKL